LPKDKVIYTYCEVGMRSLKAGRVLSEKGFQVRPLKPGYQDLLKAGFKNAK
jgi:rhodanese-related sulfurtransferase